MVNRTLRSHSPHQPGQISSLGYSSEQNPDVRQNSVAIVTHRGHTKPTLAPIHVNGPDISQLAVVTQGYQPQPDVTKPQTTDASLSGAIGDQVAYLPSSSDPRIPRADTKQSKLGEISKIVTNSTQGSAGIADSALRIIELQAQIEEANINNEEMNKDLKRTTTDLQLAKTERDDAARKFENERQKAELREKTEKGLREEIASLHQRLQASKDKDEQLLQAQKHIDELAVCASQLQETLESSNKKISRTEAQMNDLQNQIDQSEARYEDLQTKYKNASAEMNRLKGDSRSLKDDPHFQRGWQRLHGAIERWANEHFRGRLESDWSPSNPHEPPHIDWTLFELSDDCEELLRHEGARTWLIQAFVWRYLEKQVFDSIPVGYSKGLTWAQPVRSELCRMEKFLRPGITIPMPWKHAQY
jgi:archaellum component FlaC